MKLELPGKGYLIVKILVVNKFLHHVGGVETYLSWLAVNLRKHGHEVHFFGMEPPPGQAPMDVLEGNVTFSPYRSYSAVSLHTVESAAASVYSPKVASRFQDCISRFRPDVVHFNMTCRQLTPSLARVVSRNGIPSVTTAHEYKAVCANQRLWDDRRNEECMDCVGAALPSRVKSILSRRCIKGSAASSLLGALELPLSDALWSRSGTIMHAPSRYMANLLQNSPAVGGEVHYLDLSWGERLAGDGVAELDDAGQAPRVLFTGRLSEEKGVDVLLKAWPTVLEAFSDARLDIYGSGGAEAALRKLASDLGLDNARFRGRYEVSALSSMLGNASLTIHPSRWAENSPYTVRESLQHGVPAVVSNRGGLPEMVSKRTGYVYLDDSPENLAASIVQGLTERIARTEWFWDALESRVVSDDDHYAGLFKLYNLSMGL